MTDHTPDRKNRPAEAPTLLTASVPASCPIGWQPNALAPVFYGHRDYTAAQGAPVKLRVFFPSLDGSPASAAPLTGCGRYPLIMLAHGSCPGATDLYKAWFILPAQLARAGYVVVVPDVPSIGLDPASPNHPAPAALSSTLAWMRQTWEYRTMLMAPPATGIIGHSYGALLSGRVTLSENLAAYVSLSGVWGSWDSQAGGQKPIDLLKKPMLFIYGNSDLLTTSFGLGQWEKLATPRHRIVFEEGMHWDYLPAGSTPCDSNRGPCTLMAGATMDYVTMFMAKYLPPELAPQLPCQIPDTLTPPPLQLTVQQQFFAGGYLNSVQALGANPDCTVAVDWVVAPKVYFVLNQFGYNQDAGNWRIDRHPRLLGDLNGDGSVDIVGFRDDGAYGSSNKGDGTFRSPAQFVDNFGYNAGGWRVDRHPRTLADLTGTGRTDVVGFGNSGVFICHGGLTEPLRVVNDLGYNQGWRVDQHPRFLADITGDKRADIVGFGNAGVWTVLNSGNYTFRSPRFVLANLGYNAGNWRVDRHPRFLTDITGDGRADIVGFGNAGVWTALSNGDGTFQPPRFVLNNFGYNAGNWRVDQHPRFMADLTGNGRADIIGFGDDGVWTALSNGDGTFQSPRFVLNNFGYEAGTWRVDRHPRLLADLTGDGRADIVGFGNAGVWVAISNGDGTFQKPVKCINNFGYNAGTWRVDRHPRFLADITGDGRADIVGFGNAGVYVAYNKGNGTF